MKRDKILFILAHHRDELASFGLRRLALFGSVAREEAGPSSDVDVLVEFEGKASFDRYVELNFLLENLLHRRVDLVTAQSLREPLRSVVEQEACDVPGLSPVSR
jgi:predicted nucleotidyltransferase